MRLILACVIMAAAMSAQPQEIDGATDAVVRNAGVFLSGSPAAPFVTNQSTKPVIGYVVHQFGVARNQVLLFQDLLKHDNPGIQPGDSRKYEKVGQGMLSVRSAPNVITADKEMSLTAVLFGDGQWVGSDERLRGNYKRRLESLKAFGNGQTDWNSADIMIQVTHRTAAGHVEGIRQRGGEEEAKRAMARAARVPELWEEK